MHKYLIVADDFTGANDTGVQLCRRGCSVDVLFSDKLDEAGKNSLVVDTESRVKNPGAAYEILRKSAQKLDFFNYDFVIKKVDSTLRGNISEEISGFNSVFQSDLILFSPALPDAERTTVGGIQLLKGIPVCETELARDPINPVKEDHIINLLQKACKNEVQYISLEKVRQNDIDLSHGSAFVFDAVTNQDMQNIISTGLKTGKKTLWVGTAAIADNLIEIVSKSKPSFGVAASLSTTTNRQLKYAVSSGAALVQLPIYDFLAQTETPQKYIEKAVSLLKEGRDTLLVSSSSYNRDEYEKTNRAAERLNKSVEDVSAFTRALISEIAFQVLTQCETAGVFLTGGDTAIGLFNRAKASGSTILSEVATGIPLMRLRGGVCDGLKIITKAGAFGNEDAISYSLKKLREVTQ